MIVNWKKPKAGALVMPCIVNGKIVKQIFIVPGHNEISEEDWDMAKDSVERHIAAGYLVIFEKKIEAVKIVKAPKDEKVVNFQDLLTVARFPHLDVVKAIKELDLYADICAQKKKADGKATLNKAFLLQYMIDNAEDFEKVTDLLYPEDASEGEDEIIVEETPEEVTALKLTEMSSEQATDVITDTYCIKTLELWKKEVSQPDLRVLIINQIEIATAPARGSK